MLFRVPPGVGSISVGTVEFTADENGLINAEGCTPEIIHKIEHEAKCEPVVGSSSAFGSHKGIPVNGPQPSGRKGMFKVPAGVGSVSVEGREFFADDDGNILVPDITDEIAEKLVGQAHCERVRLPPLLPEQKAEKEELIERLTAAGIKLDGRLSIARLREMVVDMEKAESEKKAA